MNTKKIWIIAMFFGVIATGFLYVIISSGAPEKTKPANTVVVEEEQEDTNAENTVVAAEAESEEEEPKFLPVEKGKRAMTIAVNDVQGVAGNIAPGAFVDVVAVMSAPEEAKQEGQHDSATLLIQNVKVLGLGHAADDPETKKRYQMVTVEVTPKEGLALGFSSRYQLYLMLREDGDNDLEPEHTHVHEDNLHEGVFK